MIKITGPIESCLRCAYYQWIDSTTKRNSWCTYWNRKSDYPYGTCIAYLEVKLE